MTDLRALIFPKIGKNLPQKWTIKCNNETNDGRVVNFIKRTKTSSPTGNSGATTLPPMGNFFRIQKQVKINQAVEWFSILLNE